MCFSLIILGLLSTGDNMITSKIVLEQELSKIKKCNLCSNQTTRKDAKEYFSLRMDVLGLI